MAEMEDGLSNGEDKMEPAASSNPGLQVSVSFGRFENDSLSWEKFSSFSPNKYLEEVEKCATPGSVAQKKAYFEAHYKKIAERKAELMDQEKQADKKASFKSNVQNHGDSSRENSGPLADYGLNGGSDATYEEDKHVTDIATEVNEPDVNERNEETVVVVKECQSSFDEDKEEAGDSLDSLKFENPEEVVLVNEKPEEVVLVEEEEEKEVKEEVKEEIPPKDSEDTNEVPTEALKKEKVNHPAKTKERNVRMNRTRGSPKVNQVNKKPVTDRTVTSKNTPPSKERSVTTTTRKLASPVSKAPGFSTPRVSKPASAFTSMSASRSSIKKENVSTLTRNKQTAPKSLHMSLSLGPSGSDPTALTTTRKSLIMEQMGDKDIVKRAFKTFQKSLNQPKSSSDRQNTVPKQVPAKTANVSTLATPQKENDGSVKAGSTEKKSARAHPSFGLKTKDKAEKQREFSKISGEKSSARTVARTRLQAKPKAEVMDVKTRRHSLDPKAKPVHGSLLVQNSSKVSSSKNGPAKGGS